MIINGHREGSEELNSLSATHWKTGKLNMHGPLGDLIYKARTPKGLTQTKLADRVGVSDRTVRSWEEGHGIPSMENIPKLAEALGIKPEKVAETVEEHKAWKSRTSTTILVQDAEQDTPGKTTKLPERFTKCGLLIAAVGMVLIGMAVYLAARDSREEERRQLAQVAEEFLKDKTWIGYDPSTFKPSIDGEEPRFPKEEEIRADLQTLREYGFTGIITFAADRPPLTKAPQIAKEVGMAVIMGVHVHDKEDLELTNRQISNAIGEREHVDAYCVGHNPVIDIRLLESLLAKVRAETGKPTTTTFSLIEFRGSAGTRLRKMSDFLFPDVRPDYRDSPDVEEAVAHMRDSIVELAELRPNVPVLLKMVAFPSDPNDEQDTQARFFRKVLRDIDTPSQIYWSYFGAFDTPWKADYPRHWSPEDARTGLFHTPSRDPKKAVAVFEEQLQAQGRQHFDSAEHINH